MANEVVEPEPVPVSNVEKAHCVFLDFMTRVTQYEELSNMGKRLLEKFYQELEYFRRPKLPTESGVMSEVLKSHHTHRMKSYIEAGCTLHQQGIQNMNQLHSCEEKLLSHVKQVKSLLKEFQCLVDDVYSFTVTASLSVLSASDFHGDDNLASVCCEDKQQPGDELDIAVSFASVMVLVNNMLKLDGSMQENIIKGLSLKTSSSELASYCLMWDLRPYIDGSVMHLAWKYVG